MSFVLPSSCIVGDLPISLLFAHIDRRCVCRCWNHTDVLGQSDHIFTQLNNLLVFGVFTCVLIRVQYQILVLILYFCFNCYIDCFTYSDLYLYSPLHLHSHVLTASNIPKQYFFVYLQKNKKWHILIHLHSILIICSWIYCIVYCFIIWLSYLLGQTSYWIKVIGIFSKRKNQPPYLSFWMFW